MNVNGLHYHNSLKTSDQSFSKYRPTTEIVTEPLTDKYTIGEQIGRYCLCSCSFTIHIAISDF